MRRIIVLCCLSLVLAACARGGEKGGLFQDVGPETLHKSVRVEVTLDQEAVTLGEPVEDQLLEKAKKKGVRKAVNQWIKRGYLIRPSGASVLGSDYSEFVVHKGEFEAQEEEITRMYNQRFDVSVELTPVEQVAGEVSQIESQRSMGAGNLQVEISLRDLTPDDKGAFFVVANTDTTSQESEMARIIGSGYIYRSLGQKMQGVFMETKQEIQPGDLVFLLRTEISPVKAKQEEEKEKEEPEPAEKEPEEPKVKVQPKKEKKGPEMPGETK